MNLDLENYIDFPSIDATEYADSHRSDMLIYNIRCDEEKLKLLHEGNYRIAILGVPEDRNSNNTGSALAPDEVRKKLYSLYIPSENLKVVDLGNLKKGKNVKDTYVALHEVYTYLQSRGTIPLLIGGTQDLSIAVFEYYHNLQIPFNITNIDARIDLGKSDSILNNKSFLNQLVHTGSPYLFNYTHLAYQGYYVAYQDVDLLDDLWFEAIRLGKIQADVRDSEPCLRDSDFVTFDIGAIRQSDAPGVKPASTNGLFGQEACQMCKYAGMSDRVTGFGLFETNPTYDRNGQTAELAAQLAWHFMLGVWLRKQDFPAREISSYRKYIIATPDSDNELIFYRNSKTERWWLEVPYYSDGKENIIIISCSEKDYEVAASGDIPDCWMRYYKKLSSALR